MAIYLLTSTPQSLFREFDARISQREEKGKIITWEKSGDGQYYTHKAVEWRSKAWFKPKIESDRLTFNIIRPQGKNIATVVYAYYHGHLTETFLTHFDKDFGVAISTALAATGDDC
jgi:hypothetical protein